MADLTPTAGSVLLVSGPTGSGVFGETITAGMAIYYNAADSRLYKAIATTLAQASAVGIALNGGAAGQVGCDYAAPGAIVNLGGGTAGLFYIVSGATAGALSPHTDATTPASGEFVCAVTGCMGSSLHIVCCVNLRTAF